MDVALGLEKRANVETRGWFRLDPGQCRQVLDGTLDADMVVRARAHAAGLWQRAVAAERPGRFLHNATAISTFANARSCPTSQQAHFSAAKPSDSPKGPVINLAEEADYDDVQARLAGIQRLLVIAGYDAYPIDGVQGAKTQAAIAKFLNERKLAADAVATPANFFDALIEAARNPEGVGFSWCNDTKYPVMASLGIAEMGAIVTRGWYRVESGPVRAAGCARRSAPASTVMRKRSTATAAPSSEATRRLPGAATLALCTRDGRFELADHKDCAARGLEFRRLCGHRSWRPAGNDRAFQGTSNVVPTTCPPLRRAVSATSRPGCSISTTRSTRITSISGSRSTSASATTSRDFLKVSKDEAFRVQKDYYHRYGTTMRGMMTEHGMKPDDYLDFVHQIDHSPLEPNPALGAALEKLAGPQAHPHQRHAQARRRGDAEARHPPSFRRRVRHRRGRTRAQAVAAGLRALPRRAMASILRRPRCSRIWRATSKCRTRSA